MLYFKGLENRENKIVAPSVPPPEGVHDSGCGCGWAILDQNRSTLKDLVACMWATATGLQLIYPCDSVFAFPFFNACSTLRVS